MEGTKSSHDLFEESPMPSHTKARRLASKFDKAYPEALSERLAWWCHVLAIDRSRFLRMMGIVRR